jgi:hypothetical protein
MEVLKEGTKVSITHNGGATGIVVGLGAQLVPYNCKLYIIKLVERFGQEWCDYEYSCVNLPRSMLKVIGE